MAGARLALLLACLASCLPSKVVDCTIHAAEAKTQVLHLSLSSEPEQMKTATFRNCPIFEGSVCSGHGHCRQIKGEGLLFGVCECYSGFAGLDCRETLQQLRDRLAARAFNEDSYCKIDIDEVCPHGVSAALCDALKSSTGLRPPASEDTSEQWTRELSESDLPIRLLLNCTRIVSRSLAYRISTLQSNWDLPLEMSRLHEDVYVSGFAAALDAALAQKWNASVLDIGTGTGLWAVYAASRGAGEVVGVDMSVHAASLARITARINRVDNVVSVFGIRSDRVFIGEHLSRHVDIVVADILTPSLVRNGFAFAMKDAVQRLCSKDCTIIPQSVSISAALMSTPTVYKDREVPQTVHGVNISLFNVFSSKMENVEYDWAAVEHSLLSDFVLVAEYDFTQPKDLPGELPVYVNLKVKTAGVAHGVNLVPTLRMPFGVPRLTLGPESPNSSGLHTNSALRFFESPLDLQAGDIVTVRFWLGGLEYHMSVVRVQRRDSDLR